MIKKLIVLDTETTGLEVDQGHRIIEIGAVLLVELGVQPQQNSQHAAQRFCRPP